MKKTCAFVACALVLLCFFTGCLPNGEADKHFENALEFMDLQMLKEAVIELKNGMRILEKDPSFAKRPEQDLLAGFVLFTEGKNQPAIDALEKGVKKNPDFWTSYILLSSIYLQEKDYKKAIVALEKVPAFDYGQIEFIKGLQAFDKRNYKESIEHLKLSKEQFSAKSLTFNQESGAQAFIKKGANLMVEYLLGQAYCNAGKYFEAKTCFEAVKKTNPEFIGIGSDLLLVNSQLGLRKDPKDARLLNSLGWAYFEKKDWDNAVHSISAAIVLSPSYSLAYNNLGRVFYEKEEYDKAIAYFNKVLAFNNDDLVFVYASYNLGQLLRKQGQVKEALNVLENGLKKMPDDEGLKREFKIAMLKVKNMDFKGLGNAYFENGEYDNAVKAYQRYLTASPKDTQARYNFGRTFLLLGKLKEAKNEFIQSAAAHLELGKILKMQGQLKEAVTELEMALKCANEKQKTDILYELAYGYFETGDLKKAILEFRKFSNDQSDERYNTALKIIGVLN